MGDEFDTDFQAKLAATLDDRVTTTGKSSSIPAALAMIRPSTAALLVAELGALAGPLTHEIFSPLDHPRHGTWFDALTRPAPSGLSSHRLLAGPRDASPGRGGE